MSLQGVLCIDNMNVFHFHAKRSFFPNLQYKNDLATDNEIFAERTKESDSLRERIRELEEENMNLGEQLKDVLDKLKKHDDQLLRQQVQLNKQSTPRENGIVDGMELIQVFINVSRENSLELIELSSINKVSLV